jgi:hypothetical protein
VDPQLPRIAEGADHLRLLGQVFVGTVLYVPLIHERLEVRAVPDPVRRVDVDRLHLARHALLLEQRVHDEQRVAGDQPVLRVDPLVDVQ